MAKWLPAIVVAGAAVVAFGAAGLTGRAPKVSGEVHAAAAGSTEFPFARTIGVGGCATSGCHGGSAAESLAGRLTERTWNGAASHWLALDPHTKAYDALGTDLAGSIMARFAPGTKAMDDARCLACHTNPSLARNEAGDRERLLRAEGVSCEACHGDAGKWMPKHTTWTAANRAAESDSSGMAKLFDLGERAVMCAGCHVGAPEDKDRGYPLRDMNHDMIAAGHPRLNFDLADSQHRLPPHWREADQSPEFELKAWLVGRTACAEAAAVLKEDRTKRIQNEFADFSCVSCHHKLGDGFPSGRSTPALPAMWPLTGKSVAELRAARIKATTGSDAAAVLNEGLRSVKVDRLDLDTAGLVYHGLAARERFRVRSGKLPNHDPAFDRLRDALKQPRGNIDFRVKPEAAIELKSLLK